MDELYHLVKIAKLKRSAIVQIMRRMETTDPQYEWFRGHYDALAQIIAEIEMIHPGIDPPITEVIAPTWKQHEAGFVGRE